MKKNTTDLTAKDVLDITLQEGVQNALTDILYHVRTAATYGQTSVIIGNESSPRVITPVHDKVINVLTDRGFNVKQNMSINPPEWRLIIQW